MITIINYGMGNLGSLQNMFNYIDVKSQVTSDPDLIFKSKKIVLPGVGSFKKAMKKIKSIDGLTHVLNDIINKKEIPVLGVCLGMQLLTNYSEEGNVKGLGFINAKTIKFKPKSSQIKVPHMGWNQIIISKKSQILNGLNNTSRFYFVHSYYVDMENKSDILTKTDYDINFTSSFQNKNIFGVQFHPEKSHKNGICLLKNFSSI